MVLPSPAFGRKRGAGAVFHLFLFLLLFGLPGRLNAAAAGGEGEAFLRKVGERLSSVRTLSARFRQEVPLANLGIVRKAQGTVAFERPLKMRWDYRGDDPQLFLADGTYLYFRPPGSDRVFRRAIDEGALGGRIPLLLLFGRQDLSELFRVEEMVTRKGGAETVLRLVPRPGGAPDVRRIDLAVGSRDLLPREVHVFDRLGGANHLFLEEVKAGAELPPGYFRFLRPPGTRVVGE